MVFLLAVARIMPPPDAVTKPRTIGPVPAVRLQDDRLLIQNMVMNKVNIHEAKARLSEYVDAVQRGEQVVICRRNRPVAELRAIGTARTKPRPIGGAEGQLTIPAAFFDPLPDDLVGAFYEQPASARSSSRVAERRGSYHPTTKRRSRK